MLDFFTLPGFFAWFGALHFMWYVFAVVVVAGISVSSYFENLFIIILGYLALLVLPFGNSLYINMGFSELFAFTISFALIGAIYGLSRYIWRVKSALRDIEKKKKNDPDEYKRWLGDSDLTDKLRSLASEQVSWNRFFYWVTAWPFSVFGLVFGNSLEWLKAAGTMFVKNIWKLATSIRENLVKTAVKRIEGK